MTQKRRPPIEPISYDELMGNAGMSGFVSFLIPPLEPSREAAAAEPPPCPPRKGRIRKALTVEDGHSLAEQAVYEALGRWPSGPAAYGEALNEDRTARLGITAWRK